MKDRLAELKKDSLDKKERGSPSFFKIFPHRKSQDNDETSAFINNCSKSINKAIDEIDSSLQTLSTESDRLTTVINPKEEREIQKSISNSNTIINSSMRIIRDQTALLQEKLDSFKNTRRSSSFTKISNKEKIAYISILENVIRSSKTNLAKKIDIYNTITIKINEYSKRDIKKVVTALNPDLDEDRINNFLDEVNSNNLINTNNSENLINITNLTEEEKNKIEEINEKKKNLIQFEKNVAELLSLLSEMNNLIDQSSDLLDSVEFKIAQTADLAEEGLVQVEKAVDVNLSLNRWKYICWMGVGIFLIVIGGYAFWKVVYPESSS